MPETINAVSQTSNSQIRVAGYRTIYNPLPSNSAVDTASLSWVNVKKLEFDIDFYSGLFISLKSVYCQIVVYSAGDIRTYTVVSKISEADNDNKIIHFSNPVALNLLTMLTFRENSTVIDGKKFNFARVRYNPNITNNAFCFVSPNDFVKVYVRHNGGYYDPDDSISSVCGLVFCEKSRRLEVLQMSYSKTDRLFYVDVGIYKKFVKTHGWPIVRYIAKYKDESCRLRDEFLLRQFGYKINASCPLNDPERQALLRRIAGLDLINASSISAILSSLIKRNCEKSGYEIQCIIWQNDLEYILNNTVNPEQSAFVSKIRNL